MKESLLAQESSPYLLMHKDNPVHWMPWGRSAFAKARREGKPILLSVGYAACHWCHVMARESFEDPQTADLMNRLFINIKVDREERPDIDMTYMRALSAMGRPTGWPLTVFLDHDGKPFWGGTYFPPEPRHGLPAFCDVLSEISEAFRSDRARVSERCESITDAMTKSASDSYQQTLKPADITETAASLAEAVDETRGGLTARRKFPHPTLFRFLWNMWLRSGRPAFRDAVVLTARHLCQGGIFDHLGGGFARYTVDADWRVPHFEKMLCDNALIVELLTEMSRGAPDAVFAERVEQTIEWLLREMRIDEGGFATSLAAECDGSEGTYYTWTVDEVSALLGSEAPSFMSVYDVSASGNFQGRSVLNRLNALEPLDEGEEARLRACRRTLFAARQGRTPPERDDKVLADWNGLAITALARAGAVFDRPQWISAARDAFAFVERAMGSGVGLCHAWRNGSRSGSVVLSDYAAMARAALSLHEVTGELSYLTSAEGWTIAAIDRHWDADRNGFFLTPQDAGDVALRIRDADDEAVPSGNGLMVEVLAKLYYITGQERFRRKAEETTCAFADEPGPPSFPLATLLNGYYLLTKPVQVTIVGESGGEDVLRLMRACLHMPVADLILSRAPSVTELPPEHPARDKLQLGGKATAYVCVGTTCSAPVTNPQELISLLAENVLGT